jgi:preprotein translocase subunit SecB
MPAKNNPLTAIDQTMPLFPFRLMDVRLYEVHTEHCEIKEKKQEDAKFGFSLRHGNEPLDSKEFGILLVFEGMVPTGKQTGCQLKVSVEGQFATTVDPKSLKEDVIKQFRGLDSAVLLWPYLRQYVHDLTSRLGLELPPLPTIDVRALLVNGEKSTE